MNKISLVSWSMGSHEKLILRLTDLLNLIQVTSNEFKNKIVCYYKWVIWYRIDLILYFELLQLDTLETVRQFDKN